MDSNGGHHVARIDETVTLRNLHKRAEAVAVPDFDYLEQAIEGIAEGLRRHHLQHQQRRQQHGRHRAPEARRTGDQQ
jgi:hypothetical protein